MKRRNFVKDNVMLSGALGFGIPGLLAQSNAIESNSPKLPGQFKLKYAPHLGMFEASAGKILLIN